jgi:uncharacterized protein YutE (UPF0331/DUF86 family)
MIDRELVTRKSLLIVRDLEPLGEIARLDADTFVTSRTNQALAERYLERILGRIIDINFHVITASGAAPPSDYYASFLELGRLGILDPAFAQKLAPGAGLRNRLVHEYDEVDPLRLHDACRAAIADVPRYLTRLDAWMERACGC